MSGEQLETVTRERAAQIIDRFVARFEPSYRQLARHAALPLVLTPELVNYLRDRFLRGATPWVAESDLLLSDLCRPAGYDQYVMAPAVRSCLLMEMREIEGSGRMQETAQLLLQYLRQVERTVPHALRHELEAQQWAALVYFQDRRPEVAQRIAESLAAALLPPAEGALGIRQRAELARLARLAAELGPELGGYEALMQYARDVGELLAYAAEAPAEADLPDHARTGVNVGSITLPPIASLLAPPSNANERAATEAITSRQRRIGSQVGAELSYIPAGEFLMGSSEEEIEALLKANPGSQRENFDDEMPQHRVYLDGFYIFTRPVTVQEYLAFCKAKRRKRPEAPSFNPKWQNADHPMVNVSWADAMAYCAWLSARTGLHVTLPTEAQWEKASRGTAGGEYPWGTGWNADLCVNSTNNERGTRPVGSKPAGASPYGVLDMSGNVWEWCADWFDADYYSSSPSDNPFGPETGDFRVLRGGSWYAGGPNYFRCACRYGDYPVIRYNYVGFRCAVRSDPL